MSLNSKNKDNEDGVDWSDDDDDNGTNDNDDDEVFILMFFWIDGGRGRARGIGKQRHHKQHNGKGFISSIKAAESAIRGVISRENAAETAIRRVISSRKAPESAIRGSIRRLN